MTIYITSDLHFGHRNICGEDAFCSTRKHFADTTEMNSYLIEAINSVVTNSDTLYHLGDFSMNMKPAEVLEIAMKIRGQIHFIKGNHDTNKQLSYLSGRNYLLGDKRPKFIFHEVGTIIKQNQKSYYLTHYPLGLGEHRNRLRSICGHIHEEIAREANVINVGIDSPELPKDHPFGVPITLDVAAELVEAKWLEWVEITETLSR